MQQSRYSDRLSPVPAASTRCVPHMYAYTQSRMIAAILLFLGNRLFLIPDVNIFFLSPDNENDRHGDHDISETADQIVMYMHAGRGEPVQHISCHDAVHRQVEKRGDQVLSHAVDKGSQHGNEQVVRMEGQKVSERYEKCCYNALIKTPGQAEKIWMIDLIFAKHIIE